MVELLEYIILKKKTKCKIFKIFLPNFKTDIGFCKTYIFSIKNQLTHNYKKQTIFFSTLIKCCLSFQIQAQFILNLVQTI